MGDVTCKVRPDCPYNTDFKCVSYRIILTDDGYGHMICATYVDIDDFESSYKYGFEPNISKESILELFANKKARLTEEQRNILSGCL